MRLVAAGPLLSNTYNDIALGCRKTWTSKEAAFHPCKAAFSFSGTLKHNNQESAGSLHRGAVKLLGACFSWIKQEEGAESF